MTLSLPSYKRQQLLLEFAAIKSKCPEGVFFVRQGPYSGTVLRFEVAFPASYPETGPLFSFFTEVFHPLLVPLTTYTFAAGALDPNTTVSSSEAERLPPGSFNVGDCLPTWYSNEEGQKGLASTATANNDRDDRDANDIDIVQPQTPAERSRLLILLDYVKESFEDAEFLDTLPLRAAVNTNAWHAWRAHRGLPKLGSRSMSPASVESGRTPLSPGRNPGDWNWDGVWESRVRNAMEESTSDAVLFGSKNNRMVHNPSNSIRFVKNDDDQTQQIQTAMMQALSVVPA